MTVTPEPKHSDLSVRVSEGESTFMIVGKVTRALRNSSQHESIEEFMKLALVAESDQEFMSVVNKFVKVRNDD